MAQSRQRSSFERVKLRNGLRVVLAPDRSAPVVAVAVYYDVGIRSEPEGRTGFAHLFEHLMFQGSASLGKMELASLISASGGVLNGSTRVFDVVKGRILQREGDTPLIIPEGAVVVPGSRPVSGEFATQHGLQVATPLIVKYRDDKTDAKAALEEALR